MRSDCYGAIFQHKFLSTVFAMTPQEVGSSEDDGWLRVGHAPSPSHPPSLPLLDTSSSRKRRRPYFCRCVLQFVIVILSMLLGAAGGAFYLLEMGFVHLVPPTDETNSSSTTCPGVCTRRPLHGHFAANATASTIVGPLKVVIKFHVSHIFDWPARTVNVTIDPISHEPKWISSSIHPSRCDGVPFALGDDCNVTYSNECTDAAYKVDNVRAHQITYDTAQDMLASTETVKAGPGGAFTTTFAWEESRLSE